MKAHSTITVEMGLKLNPNCEPYVPSGSLEQVSTSSSTGFSDCDVKPYDFSEFHQKFCCYACGRPVHIARHCLQRPNEFFYGKNLKVTPKAKPVNKLVRTDQPSTPKGRPNKLKNVRYVDSGCSWHVTGDFSQLHEVTPFNRGYVSFTGDKGAKISKKGSVTNGTLSLEDVYYMEELNHTS
ncbi:hypothetical protein R6Q57_016526 [Mikania cordata]